MENLLSTKIRDDLYYIGVNDRLTTLFEGMWPLPNGVAYNSYLVRGEKNILMDLVKVNRLEVFLEKLSEVLQGENLDYIVINHVEPDHSSSLPSVLAHYPEAKIVTSKRAIQMLQNYYNVSEERIISVNDGETLTLGDKTFTFYATPMVHWPESMVTYEEATKTLFSQDIFGGFGTLNGSIFDDQINFDDYLYDETNRYFINIVGKYAPQALRALKKLEPLEIELICPVHGPIWRDNPQKIVDLYIKLASQKTIDGAVIVYGSMYGNTERMAEAVAMGLSEGGIKRIKIRDISTTPMSYVLADAWKYKGVVLGSCAYDNSIFPPMKFLLSELEHQKMKNNVWGIFGSFSWSGGAMKELQAFAEKRKIDVCSIQPEIQGAANDEEIEQLKELGRCLAKKILEQ